MRYYHIMMCYVIIINFCLDIIKDIKVRYYHIMMCYDKSMIN